MCSDVMLCHRISFFGSCRSLHEQLSAAMTAAAQTAVGSESLLLLLDALQVWQGGDECIALLVTCPLMLLLFLREGPW